MARQQIEINWKLLDTMIEAQCPIEEILERLDISQKTFHRRIREEKNTNYDNYVRKFNSIGKTNVRLIQYNKAMSGNVPMMIRWGEIYLDQREKKESSNKINITINEINPTDEYRPTTEVRNRDTVPIQMPSISELCMECTEISEY